uniref:Ig-like domain-containing protein n=1 Tax=Ursus americanus TaxID=9643 RepID=A0A452QH54_URSAM
GMPLWLLFVLWGGPLPQALSYQLELQESVTVQEALCVHVPCKFSYPWLSFAAPHMSWFQKGADVSRDPPVATSKPNQKLHERTQGRFFLRGDPQSHDCSLDIMGVNMGDSGTYFFQMGTYSYLDNMLSLNVTALTHTPDILIPETLERGRPGNLTCSVPWACEQGTPPIFSWTSAALTALGPRTHLSSVLTLTPRPQDHGTNLACQVYFPAAGVTVERTSQLDVTYAPQNTAIRIFHGNRTGTLQNTSSILIREGQPLRLRCTADSNPPAELSWFWGSPTLNATPICKSPILDLPQVGAEEEGDLTCQAQNSLGSQHVSLHLSVVCECGDPWGQAAWGLGRRGTTDPSPPSRRCPVSSRGTFPSGPQIPSFPCPVSLGFPAISHFYHYGLVLSLLELRINGIVQYLFSLSGFYHFIKRCKNPIQYASNSRASFIKTGV